MTQLQAVCGVYLDRLFAVVAVVEGAHRGGRESLQYVSELVSSRMAAVRAVIELRWSCTDYYYLRTWRPVLAMAPMMVRGSGRSTR